MKPTVVLTRRWPSEVEAVLAERYTLLKNSEDAPFSQQQMRQALCEADAVLPTVTDKLDAAVFAGIDCRAKIIANYGVGYSHIDTVAAKAAGIVVSNTPDVLSDCTADIAMTLMLMAARRAAEGEREVRENRWTGWRPTHLVGRKVSGKVLGIVGYGRIGQAMAQRAHHGFGMAIKVFNRSPVPAQQLAQHGAEQCGTLPDLLAASDFVSLHCPGGESNRYLINAEALSQMKASAYLINTARGEVVDDAALIAALRSNAIAGAGLDVFEGEPQINPAYRELQNAVLLPHLGSATEDTRVAMGMRVAKNLDAFFDGHEPPDRVA
ncbi:MAG: 2-hydroxyacid dehydrogenase [Granulosicoccaceae bacterium]